MIHLRHQRVHTNLFKKARLCYQLMIQKRKKLISKFVFIYLYGV